MNKMLYKNTSKKTQLFINLTRPTTVQPQLMRYQLYFTSLVPPLFLPDTRLGQLRDDFRLPKKVKLKQSYLQLAWFLYMSHVQIRRTRSASLLILPCKRKLYTLTKAPMAHKTNSKEQFNFKFYYFRTTLVGTLKSAKCSDSVDKSLFMLLIYKKIFPVFDTNLLYLRGCSVTAPGTDSSFYSYFYFQKTSTFLG